MLQLPKPEDFIIASGKNNSVRDLVSIAFKEIGIEDWEKYIKTDPKFVRPADVDVLLGDASKAKKVLGWEPITSFEEMIKEMVQTDIDILETKTFNTQWNSRGQTHGTYTATIFTTYDNNFTSDTDSPPPLLTMSIKGG